MALRALMKKRELDKLNAQLDELRGKADGFEQREKDLEGMINEAETDEERSAVEEEVTNFEKERDDVSAEISGLEERVAGIEKELEDLEAAQEKEPEARTEEKKHEERGVEIMSKRNIFAGLPAETRAAMFAREDVNEFISTVRQAIKEKRAITGAGLLIPEVMLDLLRENIMDYSKLIRHVNLVSVGGEAVKPIMGTIPEAVWTDCCGKLNEIDLVFNTVEVACWKVGAYFSICNAELEDSDINLASELLTALGQAIGIAVDKAILYGLGTRMPLGIVTRLAQSSKPADYPADARAWVDLHTSNIKKTNATGVQLFQAILTNGAAAKGKYSRGERVWVMNETTYTYLKAQGLSVNAAGAIVSGIDGTMPVAGGIVEVLDFVPDYDIVSGYFDLYLLAERAGTRLSQSEHVKFIDDETVFKGTARYDGAPAIAEGFMVINVNNTDPTTSISFAPDSANTESE